MAESIQVWLNRILSAKYGEEVRESIYNSINLFNKTLNDTASKFNQDAQAVAQAKVDTIAAKNEAITAKNNAISAATSASQSADIANRYQTEALRYSIQAETAKTAAEKARDEAIAAKNSAVSDINTTKTAAVKAVNDAKGEAVTVLTTARDNAVKSVNDTKTAAVTAVINQQTTSVNALKSQETDSKNAINDAKDEAQTELTNAKNDAIDAVTEAAAEITGGQYLPASATAVAAKKLETARKIELTGDVAGSTTFDGTKNVSLPIKLSKSIEGPLSVNKGTNVISTHVNATNSYIIIFRITISNPFINHPIIISFTRNYCKIPTTIAVQFNGENNTDPSINTICKFGPITVFYNKVSPGVYDFYAEKGENTDYVSINSIITERPNMITFPFTSANVPATAIKIGSALPTPFGLGYSGSGNGSYPMIFHGIGDTIFRITGNARTRNNVRRAIGYLEASDDNGVTWHPIGRIAPSSYIDQPEDLITLEYANANFESMSAKGAIYKVWKNWNNVAAINGYYKLASTSLDIDSTSGHELIEIEGNIGGFTSSGYFKLSVNERGSANTSISFEAYGFKAKNTADLLVIRNSENKREIYLKTTTTDVKWISVNLKITKLADSYAHWTVHLTSHNQSLPALASGSPSGTVEFSLKTAWPEQTNRKQITTPFVPANNAGSHNSIYRGEQIGTSITTAQNTAIKNGTFDNMYIGDYWLINNRTWRIAAFDYYYRRGADSICKTHHLLVVQDLTGTTSTGSFNSGKDASSFTTTNIWTNGIKTLVKNALNEAFPNHLLDIPIYVDSGQLSGVLSTSVCALNQIMLIGYPLYATHDNINNKDFSESGQLPLFRLAPEHIASTVYNGTTYWLRDMFTSPDNMCLYVNNQGIIKVNFIKDNTTSRNYRCYAVLKGV